MSQNRKRRAESDGNEENPTSKIMASEILKEIRSEMKKNQEKNEKKIVDLKIAILEQKLESLRENQKIRQKMEEIEMEMKKEVAILKSELLAETQQKLEKIEKKNEEKLSELKNEMLEEMKKIQKDPGEKAISREPSETAPEEMEEIQSVPKPWAFPAILGIPKIEPPSETAPEIPIREAILGEWKCVAHEKYTGCKKSSHWSNKLFSQNVKYELVDGKLQESGGYAVDFVEGEGHSGVKNLFVENNHVKSFWGVLSTIDRYIENGKLHILCRHRGDVWKRVHKKI